MRLDRKGIDHTPLWYTSVEGWAYWMRNVCTAQ